MATRTGTTIIVTQIDWDGRGSDRDHTFSVSNHPDAVERKAREIRAAYHLPSTRVRIYPGGANDGHVWDINGECADECEMLTGHAQAMG